MNANPESYQKERQHLLIERTFGNATGNAAYLLLVSVFMYPVFAAAGVPLRLLLCWWLGMGSCLIATVFIEGLYQSTRGKGGDVQLLLRRRLIAGSVTMFIWGLAPFLAWRDFSVFHFIIFAIAYGSSVTVSYGAFSILPRYYVTLAFCAMGPLILASFLRGERDFTYLGFSIIAWLVMILAKARSFSVRELSTLEEVVRLRLQLGARPSHSIHHGGESGKFALIQWLMEASARARARESKLALAIYRIGRDPSLGEAEGYFAWNAILLEATSRLRAGTDADDMLFQEHAKDVFVLYLDVNPDEAGVPSPVSAALDSLVQPFSAAPKAGGRPQSTVGVVRFSSRFEHAEELLALALEAADQAERGQRSVVMVEFERPRSEDTTASLVLNSGP